MFRTCIKFKLSNDKLYHLISEISISNFVLPVTYFIFIYVKTYAYHIIPFAFVYFLWLFPVNMYTEKQFLNHFLLLLKPAALYQSLPFSWNRKTKQIENAIKSPHQKKIYKFKCNLHVFLTAVIMIQVTLTNSQNPSTKAMCTFTVAMLFLTTVVVKEYSNWDQEAVSLLNRFIWSSREMTGKLQ